MGMSADAQYRAPSSCPREQAREGLSRVPRDRCDCEVATPNGFVCTVHHLHPKVGGTFKMAFRNFTTGQSDSFGGEYLELVPNECLRS